MQDLVDLFKRGEVEEKPPLHEAEYYLNNKKKISEMNLIAGEIGFREQR